MHTTESASSGRGKQGGRNWQTARQHKSGAIITMKMHRMRLITTTNCPFGIEDDDDSLKQGPSWAEVVRWGGHNMGDINWLPCHFVYAERTRCQRQTIELGKLEIDQTVMSSLATHPPPLPGPTSLPPPKQ